VVLCGQAFEMMSADWGGPEVADRPSNRRDWSIAEV